MAECLLDGETIKRLRLMRDMTQRQLAEAAAISYPFMSEIENNKSGASLEVIVRIAAALGTSVDRLLRRP